VTIDIEKAGLDALGRHPFYSSLVSFPANEAFKKILRDVVTPLLADVGYEKSRNVYRKVGATGNIAIIPFQRSSGSTRESSQFFVRPGLALRSQLDWTEAQAGEALTDVDEVDATLRLEVSAPSAPDDPFSARLGGRLQEALASLTNNPGISAEQLGLPPGPPGQSLSRDQMIANASGALAQLPTLPAPWWTIDDDQSAAVAADHLQTRLSALAPYLSDLLDPDFLLEQTRLPDFPQKFPVEGVTSTLSPSPEYLRLLVTVDHDPQAEFPELLQSWATEAGDRFGDFVRWLRARYAAHRP
jgi:hypothetical protein